MLLTSSCLHRVSFTGSATLPTCGSGTYGFSRFSAALGRHKKHKRIRRGKRGKNKTVAKYASQFCNIYYANVNGFKSKSESIKQLIQENDIDIVVLTETKVYNKSSTRLDGFQLFPIVRKRSGGGGLLIAVRHGICSSVMVDEGEDAEFATVKWNLGICISDCW